MCICLIYFIASNILQVRDSIIFKCIFLLTFHAAHLIHGIGVGASLYVSKTHVFICKPILERPSMWSQRRQTKSIAICLSDDPQFVVKPDVGANVIGRIPMTRITKHTTGASTISPIVGIHQVRAEILHSAHFGRRRVWKLRPDITNFFSAVPDLYKRIRYDFTL